MPCISKDRKKNIILTYNHIQFVEIENKILRRKIEALQQINEIYNNYLIDHFHNCLKPIKKGKKLSSIQQKNLVNKYISMKKNYDSYVNGYYDSLHSIEYCEYISMKNPQNGLSFKK